MVQSFDPAPQPPLSHPPSPDDRVIAMQRMEAAIAELVRKMKSGASNFYWIAALSVINSLVLEFGGNSYFVVGLASTLIVDSIFLGIASEIPEAVWIVKLIGLAISIFIAAIFVLFGFLAGKGKRWAFMVGMILYGLDSLLMLAFQEWMGLLFHGLFLYGLFGGIRALGELEKLRPQKRQSDFPQNIGV
ncbi:MAG: hypothetical protein HXY35_08255 [Chloroflexi bacterium]|nr:hypothetical protein [Chloroflexota bacterium]